MSLVEGVETESERIARETQEKEDTEARTRAESSTQARPISEQSFMQYVQMVEEGRKEKRPRKPK